MIQIHPYSHNYTTEIVDLWNSTMVADPLSKKKFLQQILLDDNFDENLSVVATCENKVVGFIWAIMRKTPYGERGLELDRAWIASIIVHPDFQRKGIGSKLLNHAEQIFKEKNVQRVTLGAYSPNYLFPGIDHNTYTSGVPFFTAHNYTTTTTAVSMEQNIFSFRKSDFFLEQKKKLIDAGYSIQPLTLDYVEELIAFLQRHFEGGWARNIKVAMQRDDALDTVLIALNPEKQIVGYAQRGIDKTPSRFGPFGVREDLRGLKLGMILFNEMLFDMFSRGIYHTYFLWTSGSNIIFYQKNGMQIYREYTLMNKQL